MSRGLHLRFSLVRHAMQKIGGALRVRRGGENRALVVFQYLD